METLKLSKSVLISLAGYLTVDVGVTPKGYVGYDVSLGMTIDGVGPMYDITIFWGDGSTQTLFSQPQPVPYQKHQYFSAGTYTVTVNVYDQGSGMTGTGTASTRIADVLVVSLTADKTSGKPPLTVKFNGGASKGYAPYSWSLGFGEGTPASGTLAAEGSIPEQTHTYYVLGNYTATLTVTDALGASLSFELGLGVGAEMPSNWAWILLLGGAAVAVWLATAKR